MHFPFGDIITINALDSELYSDTEKRTGYLREDPMNRN
jgi:hypothetical protein